MGVLTALLVILATLVGYVIYMAHKINQTWKERGVPHKKPLLFIGNSLNAILGRGGLLTINRQEVYNMFPNAPVVGYYGFLKASLMVKDIELVKRVLTTDFSYFPSRLSFAAHDQYDDLTFPGTSTGNRWKYLRNKMLPLFTSGKMRMMFEQISEISDHLVKSLNSGGKEDITGIDPKDNFIRYSIDVHGVLLFGLNLATLRDDNREVVEMTNKFSTFGHSIRWTLAMNFPHLCTKIGMSPGLPSVLQYFSGLIRRSLALRETSGVERPDFVSFVMALREKDQLKTGEKGKDSVGSAADDLIKDSDKVEITDGFILNNALNVMIGYGTIPQILVMFFYDMSQNVQEQDKLRKQLKDAMAARNQVFSYDVIHDVPYLEMCLKESMRMHTSGGHLIRQCAKEYTFPGTNVTAKPGDLIEIPVFCIHNDPAIYPEPERFIPERFAPGESRPNSTWLVFGDGPRVCIAPRFINMVAKIAVAKVLLNYEIRLSSKTLPISLAPRAVFYQTADPVYFDLKRIS